MNEIFENQKFSIREKILKKFLLENLRINFLLSRKLMMDRHEGIYCRVCHRQHFKGLRFKCLRCYNYDLCGSCYDSRIIQVPHLAEHPVQCFLTRKDQGLCYAGEPITYLPKSFTCAFCGKIGLSNYDFWMHVSTNHTYSRDTVFCSFCAAQPGGNQNFITNKLVEHLLREHQNEISFSKLVISGANESPSTEPENVFPFFSHDLLVSYLPNENTADGIVLYLS